MILNYEDHKNLKDIEKMLKKPIDGGKDHERPILDKLKSFRYKTIPRQTLNEITDHFTKSDEDFMNHPRFGFNQDYHYNNNLYVINKHEKNVGGHGNSSFMDFFSRKLKTEVSDRIKKEAEQCEMIIPNECYIESIGEFDKEKQGKPDNQILRLKKESGAYATEDLKKLDIDVRGYNYINMKLLVTFYHRIHCAVKGKIVQLIPIEGNDDFFGKNSLWIVQYDIPGKSPIYHMLVGESTIQDFDFLKEKMDDVDIFDTLGMFNWGSQTVLLYNSKDFGELAVKEKTKYFVGDCIFKK